MKTVKKNFGVECSLQSDIVKRKIKHTCLNRYGWDNPSKNKTVKEKKLNTATKNYGCHQSSSDDIKEKKRQTSLNHYGVNNPNQSQEIKEKIKQTCLQKYGVPSTLYCNDIQRKIKDSLMSKYGVEFPSQIPSVRKQRRISAVNRIENQQLHGEPLIPTIGYNERKCLDELQKYTPFDIIRNDNSFRYIIGRFPDGHIKELKLFILFDERFHFTTDDCTIYNEQSVNEFKDYQSMNEYKILRISQKEWDDNNQVIIKKFKEVVNEQ